MTRPFLTLVLEPNMNKMFGYQQLLNSLYDDKNLDSISRDILIFLNCFPKNVFVTGKTISVKTGQSVSTVKRRLNKLESLGYLERACRKGVNGSNRYYLNYERIRPTQALAHTELTSASNAGLSSHRPHHEVTVTPGMGSQRATMNSYYEKLKMNYKLASPQALEGPGSAEEVECRAQISEPMDEERQDPKSEEKPYIAAHLSFLRSLSSRAREAQFENLRRNQPGLYSWVKEAWDEIERKEDFRTGRTNALSDVLTMDFSS